MSGGCMYSQPVIPECSAADGPVYLVRELIVGHDQVEVSNSVCITFATFMCLMRDKCSKCFETTFHH